jgi:transposase
MIQLRAAIPLWLEDLESGLTQRFRRLLRGLWLDLLKLEVRVKELDQEIEIVALTDPVATRLQQLRGVGPIITTAIVANIGDAKQFSGGRQMAASLGLTPRKNSSGSKKGFLGITNALDTRARSVLRTAASKNDRMSRWATHIAQTRHHNIAAVALVSKTARIACAMMNKGTDYQPGAVADVD